MSKAQELIERLQQQGYFKSDLRTGLPENCTCKYEGENPKQFVWNPSCPVHPFLPKETPNIYVGEEFGIAARR